jgi:hypothetical protein
MGRIGAAGPERLRKQFLARVSGDGIGIAAQADELWFTASVMMSGYS